MHWKSIQCHTLSLYITCTCFYREDSESLLFRFQCGTKTPLAPQRLPACTFLVDPYLCRMPRAEWKQAIGAACRMYFILVWSGVSGMWARASAVETLSHLQVLRASGRSEGRWKENPYGISHVKELRATLPRLRQTAINTCSPEQACNNTKEICHLPFFPPPSLPFRLRLMWMSLPPYWYHPYKWHKQKTKYCIAHCRIHKQLSF